MRFIFLYSLIAAACLAATDLAVAQQTTPTPVPEASAPQVGMGASGAIHRDWYRDKDDMPGWSLMTPQERDEHHQRMKSMKTLEECRAYMDQHHASMIERAKSHGIAMPKQPRHDPCRRMKHQPRSGS